MQAYDTVEKVKIGIVSTPCWPLISKVFLNRCVMTCLKRPFSTPRKVIYYVVNSEVPGPLPRTFSIVSVDFDTTGHLTFCTHFRGCRTAGQINPK